MKKIVLLAASFMLVFATSALAANLPAGTLLTIDKGYNGAVSYFTMVASTAGASTTNIRSTDKTTGIQVPESLDGGIILGTPQAAGTGSHAGAPNFTVDNGPIDKPWSFFGNTGHHFDAGGITADPVAGTAVMLNNWFVTWAGIPAINMGGDLANFGSDTGIASFVVSGTNYTLDHAAHVPLCDASGFGGVPYTVHLEGRIVAAAIPEPASLLLIGSGLVGILGLARKKK